MPPDEIFEPYLNKMLELRVPSTEQHIKKVNSKKPQREKVKVSGRVPGTSTVFRNMLYKIEDGEDDFKSLRKDSDTNIAKTVISSRDFLTSENNNEASQLNRYKESDLHFQGA